MDILTNAYPEITNAEAGTAIMLTRGLSNKDIASLTLTTVRNIEKHRFNLRKKLKLKRDDDLIRNIRKVIGEKE
jgi:DNA-binding NarL/FixJ family response regulator